MPRAQHPHRIPLWTAVAFALLSALPVAGEILQGAADGGLIVAGAGRAARVGAAVGSEPLELLAGEEPHAVVPLAAGAVVTAVGAGGQSGGIDISVVLRQRGETRRLPLPVAVDPLRLAPVPLVTAGELTGLAWLEGEGPRTLAVRWAPWTGAAWGPAVTVAPPAAGTQIALDGCTLGDGRSLLAWSAFDGTDDEILWTAGDGNGWPAPRRLHPANAVPDVTPHLLCDDAGGALVVWSAYHERHYRLEVAHFDGSAWRPAGLLPGRGAVEPSIHRLDGTLLVLYRTAEAQAWRVAELDASGRLRRVALAPDSDRDRPLLAAGDRGPILTWGAELPEANRAALDRPSLSLPWVAAERAEP